MGQPASCPPLRQAQGRLYRKERDKGGATVTPKSKAADEGIRATQTLPAPGLQHLGFVDPSCGQAFHRADEVFGHFK
jgi:hypothetical protein